MLHGLAGRGSPHGTPAAVGIRASRGRVSCVDRASLILPGIAPSVGALAPPFAAAGSPT